MYLDEDIFNFLKDRRIEINAVKNAVGAEELMNRIVRKLDEIYPSRNYNRTIVLPELYYSYRQNCIIYLT